MALGRWKQRAISLDSLESTDTLPPEDSEIQVAKKPRIHSENKRTGAAPLKNFIGIPDDEDRPSSGDSGISSDHHSTNQSRLTLNQRITEEISDVNQSATAVDLSKHSKSHNNKNYSSKAAMRVHKLQPNADADNKENEPDQAQCHKSNRNRQKKVTKGGLSSQATKASSSNAVDANSESNERDTAANSEGQDNTADSLRLRRIEANARERTRVHTIGAAFDALRQAVPSNCDQQKLSKLAVLRIAAAYIRSLAALAQGDPDDFAGGVNQVTQALFMDGARTKTSRSA